ncbi:MAG: penicillin-binding protein 2, partial [Actinomycetota bacterium]
MNLATDRSLQPKRIQFAVAIIGIILLVFAIRLLDLQALRSNDLMVKASGELERTATIPAPRGAILDANGIELARSVLSYRIVVDQKLIHDGEEVAKVVAPILEMDETYLAARLTGDRRYVVIADRVRPAIWRTMEARIETYNEKVIEERNGYAKRISGFWA